MQTIDQINRGKGAIWLAGHAIAIRLMENEAAISFTSMDNSIFRHSCRKMLITGWLIFEWF
ncbi:hypothetical protein [Providencia alcalifaciens]|uniref:hypothetical protein n=1 Tax=Providencia alcalifaciens TaxID=126385 RepID=UPI001D15E7A3|nr:hypothetical protein [Providencia alcalifaciens]